MTIMDSIKEREEEEEESAKEKEEGNENMNTEETRLDGGFCPPASSTAGAKPEENSLNFGDR